MRESYAKGHRYVAGGTFIDDWSDPRAMYQRAEEQLRDDECTEPFIVSSDAEHHAERIREAEQLGATIVNLQNASGSDPVGALRVYGERVLPALRGTRVG